MHAPAPPPFRPVPDRPAPPRLRRGRGRQRPGRSQPRRRAAAAHRRHRRRADGRGRRAGDPRRPRLARAGARGRARAPERAARAPRRRRAASCSRRRMPIAASARRRRSATTAAAGRSRAPRRSGGTRPASRTSSASACPAPRSSWRTRRAAPCASPATRSPTSCSCARTGGRRSTSPPRSTTAISRSRTSCAARITSPTRPRHLLLLRALGAVEPVFAHCPIIVGADGERLSARRGAEPLAALRARGVPPEAVVAYAAQLACPAQGGASEVAVVRGARAALLARAPRARHGARRPGASRMARPRGARAACRATSSRAAWRRSCPPRRPTSSLARARGGGARRLRRSARSRTLLRNWHSDRPAPPPPAPALELFCELREADEREHLPYAAAERARRSAARAREEPRPLGPRRATPPENRPHGRAATACRSRSWSRCCRVRKPSNAAGHDNTKALRQLER